MRTTYKRAPVFSGVGKKNGHTHRFCFFDALPPPPVDFGVVCPATSALLPPPVGLPSPCAVERMKIYNLYTDPNPNPKCIVQQVMTHNVIIVTTMGSGRSKSERSDPIVLINWQMKTDERGGAKYMSLPVRIQQVSLLLYALPTGATTSPRPKQSTTSKHANNKPS